MWGQQPDVSSLFLWVSTNAIGPLCGMDLGYMWPGVGMLLV